MPDLRRHWFFILLSLAERDRHGSGIVRDVLDLTGGELRLWPVTLYGSLDELRENGWIRELGAAPEPDEDRGHRRWFRITPQGRRALLAEMERMRSLVAFAQRFASFPRTCASATAPRSKPCSPMSPRWPARAVCRATWLSSSQRCGTSCAEHPTNTGGGVAVVATRIPRCARSLPTCGLPSGPSVDSRGPRPSSS